MTKKIYAAVFCIAILSKILIGADEAKEAEIYVFEKLPYAYDALEPHIDAQTMEIHYSRHHKGYFDNMINLLKENNLYGKSLEELFENISELPVALRNNAGGHWNHTHFWKIMSPQGGGNPSGKLAKAIEESFGSFDKFKKVFSQNALRVFGSGWAWLCVDDSGKLFVTTTANQDNPLMNLAQKRGAPILGIDVWEHAYYLKYQNRRANYIDAFWNVVNWQEVEKLYLFAIEQSNVNIIKD